MSIPVYLSNGQVLNIKIKRSTRLKSIRLEANVYGVHVVSPVNYEFQNMIRFIDSRKNWILKVYEYYGRFVDIYRLQILRDKIPFNVISHNLKIITFHVTDKRKCKEDIRRWYKSETSRIIFERIPLISSKLDLRYNKVSIKSQKSRWVAALRIRI